MAFKPAQRKNAKLKILLTAPSGSGKTWTALEIGVLLCELLGISKPPALLDSEKNSAAKYAWREGTDDGPGNRRFDHDNLDDKNPQEYLLKIREAAESGYGVLIVDSLSHSWKAVLEQVDRMGGWVKAGKVVTPLLERLTDAILMYPGHVICTARSKTETTFEKDEKTGKVTPKTLGLSPIVRDGTEYEFDIVLDFDKAGNITVSKSRCPAISADVVYSRADVPKMVERIVAWLGEGAKQTPLEQLSERIKFALSPEALDALKPEIGKLSPEERQVLKPVYLARRAALEVPA